MHYSKLIVKKIHTDSCLRLFEISIIIANIQKIVLVLSEMSLVLTQQWSLIFIETVKETELFAPKMAFVLILEGGLYLSSKEKSLKLTWNDNDNNNSDKVSR